MIEYARQRGNQNEIVEALFQMFCEEGKALNNVENLVAVATSLGFDGSHLKAYLQNNVDKQEVYELANDVKDMAQGVPTYIFTLSEFEDVKYTFSGAQPPDAFHRVFRELVAH